MKKNKIKELQTKVIVMNTTPLTIAAYLVEHPNVRFVNGKRKEVVK